LKHIPTVGSSGIITSWIDAFKFVFYAKEIIHEGYVKARIRLCHYGSTFKVPLLDKWIIVVSGAEKLEDIRKSSREQLSVMDAINDLLQMDYTMGRCVAGDPYHIDVVGDALTHNIPACFADVHDEIKVAFRDNIPMSEEWISIPLFEAIRQIVCRANSRMFVRLPICRDRDYIKLSIDFTERVFLYASLLNHVPTILGPIFTPRNRALAKTENILGSTIRERLVHGKDWQDKPHDLLSWCLDATNNNETRRTIPDLSSRLLSLNMGAIHTISEAFTTVLYALAIHPEYVQTLRSEVESIIEEEGYTKVTMGKMAQLDSFMMEALRVYGNISVFGMRRIARKDFIFSDGTIVPAGSYTAVPAFSTNMDERNYKDPLEFKPWRFSDGRDDDKHPQLVSPGINFMIFGYGRHQCPSRFLAVIELKIMMSHVLLNFDVKMGKIPPPIWISEFVYIGRSNVLLRKR
ncbi:cytochrome P450, partial [Armillaria novae-zelandiae]